MPGARVTLTRRSPDDARERELVVSIDGRKLATLRYGGSFTADIEPGPHRMRVHNTLFWKTIHFEVKPGTTAGFTIVNRPGRGTTGLLSILGARPLYVDVFPDDAA